MLGFAPLGGAPLGAPLLLGGGGGGGGGTTYDEVVSEGLAIGSILAGFTGLVVEADATETCRIITSSAVGRGAALTDVVTTEAVLTAHRGIIVLERLRIADPLNPGWRAHFYLTDSFDVSDRLLQALPIVLTDGIGLELTEAQQTAVRLLEELRVEGTASAAGVFHIGVSEQLIRLQDSLAQFIGADMVDGIAIAATLTPRKLATGTLADGVGVELEVTPQFLLSARITDEIELEAEDIVQMLFSPTLEDGIEINAGYVAPDGSFTTWAMNARTGAVTEYSNYAFNSFARHGNRYLGASADGLYELLGDDDDGDNIVARLRSGFMQFGGTHLARLKAAYIAARGEGDIILKIITADGVTYNYQTSTRNMRSTKVHMGKGQRARYFAFELISAGQDFDLDTLEFVPIVVQRRV